MTDSRPGRLVLNVADLLRHPGSRCDIDRELDLGPLAVGEVSLDPREPVRASLTLESLPDQLVVSGHLRAGWEGPCRRCLAPAHGEVGVEFRELFERRPVEGESYPIEHDQIDLEPLVREAVLLELPLAPLCRPDCKGLCPVCGADRNVASCTCEPEARDLRWAALDQLRFDEPDPRRRAGG